MTAFQGAVLKAQLGRLPRQAERRAANVAYFREGLREIPGLVLPEDDPRIDRHPYYLLTLWYQPEAFSGLQRDLAVQALQAEGVPFKLTYPHPLYRNPLFAADQNTMARCANWHAAQNYANLQLPESERACREGVWLSHNVFLGEKRDIDDVLDAIRKVQLLASTLKPETVAKH
jgi:dTDP-4-amino-4,6-dideoxygalactose transaminase